MFFLWLFGLLHGKTHKKHVPILSEICQNVFILRFSKIGTARNKAMKKD
tara:strand:- start:380 stop:526 length:147 start_codon:yes stop_codon:yes gene_type:complete